MSKNFTESGVLIVDKSRGLTSRDIVDRVSKILGIKKIGHTGTLDPLATGVLVLTLGKFTKLSDLLMSKYKIYRAEMVLGYETDTLDVTGNIVEKSSKKVSDEEIIETISSFVKTYEQTVPLYSAVKINGKKLYEYARENVEVELPRKFVEIKSIFNINIIDSKVIFTCVVSKGTYIRSLIRDIGRALNTFATMTELRRLEQGGFSIDEAYTLEDIENGNYHIFGVDEVLKNVDAIEIENDDDYKKIANGVIQNLPDKGELLIYKYNGAVVALYKREYDGKYHIKIKF